MSIEVVPPPVWEFEVLTKEFPGEILRRSEKLRHWMLTLAAVVLFCPIFGVAAGFTGVTLVTRADAWEKAVGLLCVLGLALMLVLAVGHVNSYSKRRFGAEAKQDRDQSFRRVIEADLKRLCNQITSTEFPLLELTDLGDSLLVVFFAAGVLDKTCSATVPKETGVEMYSLKDAGYQPIVKFDAANWELPPTLPGPKNRVRVRITVSDAVVWVQDPVYQVTWPFILHKKGVIR